MSFQVIFFDGEQETSLGNVLITPSLDFKVFQSIISERLVLSPHQFSIYLSDRKNHSSRIPVTGKIDFSSLSRQKDSFFLVVLKRSSRRDRRRKTRDVNSASDILRPVSQTPATAANMMMLLRRDGNSVAVNVDFDRFGYEKRVKELQLEKERYLMNMGLGSSLGFDSGLGQDRVHNANIGVAAAATVVCEECFRAKEMGLEVGFHWCVYDAVTFGFKSPAGPIARPAKGSG